MSSSRAFSSFVILAFSGVIPGAWVSPRCLISSMKPCFSATLVATASSMDWFIEAKMLISMSSEINLKGLRPSATANSRTMIGGFRWMILTSPSWVTTIADTGAEVGVAGRVGADLTVEGGVEKEGRDAGTGGGAI